MLQSDALITQLAEALAQGATLGDIRGCTTEEFEAVYFLGHQLYSNARYLDALKCFGFLVMHSPYERRFVLAYASALHMLKRYKDAFGYYSMGSAMDMRDPVPIFHSAECLIALRMISEAKLALSYVDSMCEQADQMPLKERARGLLSLLGAQPSEKEQSKEL